MKSMVVPGLLLVFGFETGGLKICELHPGEKIVVVHESTLDTFEQNADVGGVAHFKNLPPGTVHVVKGGNIPLQSVDFQISTGTKEWNCNPSYRPGVGDRKSVV